MIVLNMRFGGFLVRVVMLLVFVVYVMDSVNVLESLLCILRVFGVVLFFDGELLIENCVCLVNCYKINKFKLYGINFKLNDIV